MRFKVIYRPRHRKKLVRDDAIHNVYEPHIEIEPRLPLVWVMRYYDGFGPIPAINNQRLWGSQKSVLRQARKMAIWYERRQARRWRKTHVIMTDGMEGMDYGYRTSRTRPAHSAKTQTLPSGLEPVTGPQHLSRAQTNVPQADGVGRSSPKVRASGCEIDQPQAHRTLRVL